MHGEAGLMTAQTLRRAWPLPVTVEPEELGGWPGDVEVPAGRYRVGADPGDGFVFDNEKWAHDVDLDPSGSRGTGDECRVCRLR